MISHIERLVQQLDDSTDPPYDALVGLIGNGSACLERQTPPDWTTPYVHPVEEARTWSLLEAAEPPAMTTSSLAEADARPGRFR